MKMQRSRPGSLVSWVRNDISARLIAVMLLVAIVPMTVLGFTGRQSLQSALVGSQITALDTVHDSTSAGVENFLRETQTLLEVTAENAALLRYVQADAGLRVAFQTDASTILRRLVSVQGHLRCGCLCRLARGPATERDQARYQRGPRRERGQSSASISRPRRVGRPSSPTRRSNSARRRRSYFTISVPVARHESDDGYGAGCRCHRRLTMRVSNQALQNVLDGNITMNQQASGNRPAEPRHLAGRSPGRDRVVRRGAARRH
ncbi:MAG: hypothetical protein U0232_18805 [Thermomicrobiales bacterium]